MKNIVKMLPLFFMFSCAVSKQTTTVHTAVEHALLSSSLRAAINSFNFSSLFGRKVFLDRVEVIEGRTDGEIPTFENDHSVQINHVKMAMLEELLKNGAQVVESKENAEILVNAAVDVAAIDEGGFNIGLPSIPIPVPGVGIVETPELSLFGIKSQYGRSRMSAFGYERNPGVLTFSDKSKGVERYYTRWNFLIIFSWRTTDLGKPF